MLFHLIVYSFALLTLLLPVVISLLNRYDIMTKKPGNMFLPILAGILFVVSFYLPDIGISPETSTFQQHLVGGGVYSGLLYFYLKPFLIGKRLHWLADLILLFAWVSTLGVLNKLTEFALLKAGIMQLDTSDAYWDLLANTIGAFVIYILLKLIRWLGNMPMKSRG